MLCVSSLVLVSSRWLFIMLPRLEHTSSPNACISGLPKGTVTFLPESLATHDRFSTKLFIRLGITTLTSFLILFLPWLPPFAPLRAILDPITRIFPFNRGLFEDKVANFWCASNVVLKWRLWAAQGVLIKLSTALTALGFLPAVATLLYSGYKLRVWSTTETSPNKDTHDERRVDNAPAKGSAPAPPTPLLPLLPYALLTSSLSFFLFSFQVHEKTILVPLLPMTLLLSGSSPDEQTFDLGMLMNNVAMFR